MKSSEFIRWLQKQGVVFKPGKGSHMIATLNGKSSVVPNHGSKEIKTGTMNAIKKQLGLKE